MQFLDDDQRSGKRVTRVQHGRVCRNEGRHKVVPLPGIRSGSDSAYHRRGPYAPNTEIYDFLQSKR